MANTRNGNTWYVDATGNLGSEKNVIVPYIYITATAANGRVVLSDQVTTALKADLRVEVSGHTEIFRMAENPMRFPNGINITTLTNAIVTIVVTSQGN